MISLEKTHGFSTSMILCLPQGTAFLYLCWLTWLTLYPLKSVFDQKPVYTLQPLLHHHVLMQSPLDYKKCHVGGMPSSDTHFLVSLELEPESIGDFHCRSPSLKDFEVAFKKKNSEIIIPVPYDEIPPKKNIQKTLWFRKLEFLSFWVPSHGGIS